MIPQHIYLIVPDEDATQISADVRMILDNSLLYAFGWMVSRVHVVEIGKTNSKTALHLYFLENEKFQDWTDLIQALQFNTELEDPLSDIEAVESALCLKVGVMICRDIGHLKERDPDFAAVTTSIDEDGNTVECQVLRDAVIAV